MTVGDSIKKTIAYGKVFDYPQNKNDVYHWLITSHRIKKTIFEKNIHLKTSTKDSKKREARLNSSLLKKELAQKLMSPLSKFPFVWFVGLSGSVAINNAKTKDDIDIFIITAPSTLWLIRPCLLLYLTVKKVRRARNTHPNNVNNLICPNLWLDAKNLFLDKSKQNLYTAHEVLQVYPLINKYQTYEQFIQKNSWVKKYLANAYPTPLRAKRGNPSPLRFLCYLLVPLNLIFFLLQLVIMFPYKNISDLGLGRAFFHNPKFQHNILKKHSQISYNQ